MSAGKSYGDTCDSDQCEFNEDNKCQKYSEFYDPDIPTAEKIDAIEALLMNNIQLYGSIREEIKTLISIAKTLKGEDIDDVLNEIEQNIQEKDK